MEKEKVKQVFLDASEIANEVIRNAGTYGLINYESLLLSIVSALIQDDADGTSNKKQNIMMALQAVGGISGMAKCPSHILSQIESAFEVKLSEDPSKLVGYGQ